MGSTLAPSVVQPPAPPNRLHAPAGDDAFFRHLVAGMRNAVLAITRHGTIALINDEAYRIFGLTPQSRDLGRPVADVLCDHPDIVRVLSSVFDDVLLPNRAEMRLQPSGRVIGYTIAHVHADTGAIVGASMFFKDLTRVEQLEERERLRDRLAAVGQMAATIAHEVKNPLAGIEVIAGVLRRRVPDNPDAQKMLADIIGEAKMANAIVQEVLDFVRPIRLQVDGTSVAEAIDASVTLADSKVVRRSTRLTLMVPSDLPMIQADRYQLTQLFTNLLINAYEALDGAGQVRVHARCVGMDTGTHRPLPAIAVEVSDDGPGMTQETADSVFDPFFTTKARGSGLGLAIVRRIVDAHDGRLDLRTAPGHGTTITITLPVDMTGH